MIGKMRSRCGSLWASENGIVAFDGERRLNVQLPRSVDTVWEDDHDRISGNVVKCCRNGILLLGAARREGPNVVKDAAGAKRIIARHPAKGIQHERNERL